MNTPQNTFPTLPESEQEEFDRLSPLDKIECLQLQSDQLWKRIEYHQSKEIHHRNVIKYSSRAIDEISNLTLKIQNEIDAENSSESKDEPAEPAFKGWITNRPPTEADADEDGDVAIYDIGWHKDWTFVPFQSAIDRAIPWMCFHEAYKQFKFTNAPSPYYQEVSA